MCFIIQTLKILMKYLIKQVHIKFLHSFKNRKLLYNIKIKDMKKKWNEKQSGKRYIYRRDVI